MFQILNTQETINDLKTIIIAVGARMMEEEAERIRIEELERKRIEEEAERRRREEGTWLGKIKSCGRWIVDKVKACGKWISDKVEVCGKWIAEKINGTQIENETPVMEEIVEEGINGAEMGAYIAVYPTLMLEEEEVSEMMDAELDVDIEEETIDVELDMDTEEESVGEEIKKVEVAELKVVEEDLDEVINGNRETSITGDNI
jgi:hypothetical protein